jgi:hypothetical protein
MFECASSRCIEFIPRAGTHIGNLFGKETGRLVTPEKRGSRRAIKRPPGDSGLGEGIGG